MAILDKDKLWLAPQRYQFLKTEMNNRFTDS